MDKNGRTPARASSIKDMSATENVSSQQSFLSLANYYDVFSPK